MPADGVGVSGTTVTWAAPTSAAGCDVSPIAFYRIYRRVSETGAALPAGTVPLLSERIFATSGGRITQWTDSAHTNKTSYWVTSVDDLNAESIVAGPVK